MSATMRQIFGETLNLLAAEYPRMVVLDADVSSSTQTRIFGEAHPARFYNMGIAEGNMAAVAAGLAACGRVPVVSTFAFLLAARALDPIHSLIAYNDLNVKLAGGYAGLSDFADGASHQSICDVAIMRALPNMTVLCPSDAETTVAAMRAMMAHEGPVYLRLSRDVAGSLHGGQADVRIGRAIALREGSDATIVVAGTLLGAALAAADALAAQGLSVGVLEAVSVKPLDEAAIARAARTSGRLVTLEEHTVVGGLGDAVCAAVCAHAPVPVLRLGLQDEFGQSARSYAALLQAHALDAASVARAVAAFVRGA